MTRYPTPAEEDRETDAQGQASVGDSRLSITIRIQGMESNLADSSPTDDTYNNNTNAVASTPHQDTLSPPSPHLSSPHPTEYQCLEPYCISAAAPEHHDGLSAYPQQPQTNAGQMTVPMTPAQLQQDRHHSSSTRCSRLDAASANLWSSPPSAGHYMPEDFEHYSLDHSGMQAHDHRQDSPRSTSQLWNYPLVDTYAQQLGWATSHQQQVDEHGGVPHHLRHCTAIPSDSLSYAPYSPFVGRGGEVGNFSSAATYDGSFHHSAFSPNQGVFSRSAASIEGLSPCSTNLKFEGGQQESDDARSAAAMSEFGGDDPYFGALPSETATLADVSGSANVPAVVGNAGGSGNAKMEEPYAVLIWRAVKSAPEFTMSLQQIYQWFRENTDKAKADNKGWQNSIRHNLSMNAAFRKAEPKPSSNAAEAAEAAKKSTDWVLQPWAIDGVESTTRYRKPNPNRRTGGGSLPSARSSYAHPHQGSGSGRASSGRKGGISTGKTKVSRAMRASSSSSSAAAAASAFTSHFPVDGAAAYTYQHHHHAAAGGGTRSSGGGGGHSISDDETQPLTPEDAGALAALPGGGAFDAYGPYGAVAYAHRVGVYHAPSPAGMGGDGSAAAEAEGYDGGVGVEGALEECGGWDGSGMY